MSVRFSRTKREAGRGSRTAAALTALASLTAAIVLGVSPAFAVTNVDALVAACENETVCTYDSASIADPGAVEGALPEGVRVVVIPEPDQAQSVPSSTLAAQFKSQTGAETVIVIEDRAKDRIFVASDGDARAITEALNSQGQADGGAAVAALDWGSFTGQSEQPDTAQGAQESPAGGGAALAIAIAAAVLLGAIGTTIAIVSRRRKRTAHGRIAGNRRAEKELEAALDGESGEFIRAAIERLRVLAGAYPDIGERIASLAQHVSELFIRVRKRGTEQQTRLLQSQYQDTLAKLLKALDDDYYGDILRNPQFWSGADARLAEVQRAVVSVDEQAVENIRQVNESRDLDFKVALDSLIKTVTDAKLSDVYSDREQ